MRSFLLGALFVVVLLAATALPVGGTSHAAVQTPEPAHWWPRAWDR